MKINKKIANIQKIMKFIDFHIGKNENHENVLFNARILKIMKFIEFHARTTKIMKNYYSTPESRKS